MSLQKLNKTEWLDEPGQPHYTLDDVKRADARAAEAWDLYNSAGDFDPGEWTDMFFCVCYGELCAYPAGEDPGGSYEGRVYDHVGGTWQPLP